MKLYDRCMGQCCEDIGLVCSPDELESSYKAWLTWLTSSPSLDSKKPASLIQDIHILYPMLKFIKMNKTHPECKTKGKSGTVYHYTCVHYDKAKRKCTIYPHRPTMCSTYPNSGHCNNPRCQWKEKVEARPADWKPS